MAGRAPLLALGTAFVAGIVFWGGFNTAMELTNTESFCISCHEMRDNVYREYRKSAHYANRTGVRATCPDCHVPKAWTHKVIRKIRATNELFHAIRGDLDTREKFLARRIALARHVWADMKASDSRECRNCHAFDAMDLARQRPASRQRHHEGREAGKTCIDCHKGVTHELAEEFLEAEHERFERDKVPCGDCHADMARPPPGDDWSDDN